MKKESNTINLLFSNNDYKQLMKLKRPTVEADLKEIEPMVKEWIYGGNNDGI